MFLSAIGHTLVLGLGQTAGSIVIGLVLALLVEGQAKSLWVVRTAVFLPVVAAIAVVAEVWRILYYPAPTAHQQRPRLGRRRARAVPRQPGHVAVVGHGRRHLERRAVRHDDLPRGTRRRRPDPVRGVRSGRCSAWRRLWHVTLPSLRRGLRDPVHPRRHPRMRVFTEMFLLTNGGPNGSTEVLMTLIYKLGLERNELGVAAAGSVVLLLSTVVLTLAMQSARARRAQR